MSMSVETSYTSLRENLASVLDRVVDDQEVIIVRRKGENRDVALIPASELASLMETVYLTSSPKNAARLLAAKRRTDKGKGKKMSTGQLRREMGLVD